MSTASAPYRILMVCTGNICRSTTAEGVLRHMLKEAGLADRVAVDSAGTKDWHEGESPTPQAVVSAEARGYDFTGIFSRPLRPSDYTEFDLILGMDDSHIAHLTRSKPASASPDIRLFLDAAPDVGRHDVPDPYYGGVPEYEYSLDLIEAGCKAWVQALRERL